MIVVTVELWSAVTGRHTVLGKAVIINDGTGNRTHGNYSVTFGRKNEHDVQRILTFGRKHCRVEGFPRVSKNVWHLLKRVLEKAGYQ